MLLIFSYKAIFFHLFFSNIVMYNLSIACAISELRHFIFEKYYKRIEFVKESRYHSVKRSKIRSVIACNQINKRIS